MRHKLSFVLASALVLTICGQAAAHDFFIMPEKFRVQQGQSLTIGFHSSDGFPESTQLAKRAKDAFVHTSAKPVPVSFKEDGKRIVGTMTVPHSGHVIATVINATSTTTMKPDGFLSYLKEEGLKHVIDARAQRGESDKPGRERYTMYAKSILLAGAPNDGYKRAVGLPIEIIPEKDPYSLKSGEALPVRVLYKGSPAANLDILAASTIAPKNQSIGRTDSQGRISVPVKAGMWRLHAIHMERVSDPEVDWESHWATLTFEVP